MAGYTYDKIRILYRNSCIVREIIFGRKLSRSEECTVNYIRSNIQYSNTILKTTYSYHISERT